MSYIRRDRPEMPPPPSKIVRGILIGLALAVPLWGLLLLLFWWMVR
jgi:hypothetical protein